jgi:hypothetical protein
MKMYVQCPLREMQSMICPGPVPLSNHEKVRWVREQLGKEGICIPLPAGD